MEHTCGILQEPTMGKHFCMLNSATYNSSCELRWFPATTESNKWLESTGSKIKA